MKRYIISGAVGFGLLAAFTIALICSGCAGFRTGAPPTGVERSLFTVETNYLPVVKAVTNYVPVTVFQTNQVAVPVTNEVGVTVYKTNQVVVSQTVQQPQVGTETNQEANYVYKAKPGTTGTVQAVGTAVNTFAPGIGGLVSTGLAGLLGFWAWFRSSKQAGTNYDTGAALAQEIQTIRNFVQQLPNGTTYDTALTNFLTQHQAQTDTISQVLDLLKQEVSNKDAQVAAIQIQQTIAALNASNPPTPPPAPKM